MTQAERDVIEAARAAVRTETKGSLIVADLVRDGEKLGLLVGAVVRLNKERELASYWR